MVEHANLRYLQRALHFPGVAISDIIAAEQRAEAKKYKNVAFVLGQNGPELFLSIVRGQQTQTCLVTDKQGLSPKRLRVDKVIYAC